MQDALTAAIDMHQTGQLGPAAQLYQKVLAQEQENADALHLLGVLRHQQGDHAKAVELIRRAIAMRPSVPAFHANLAEAYRAQGQFDRAVGSCRLPGCRANSAARQAILVRQPAIARSAKELPLARIVDLAKSQLCGHLEVAI
jgi:Flp pilus assembly protein TadD